MEIIWMQKDDFWAYADKRHSASPKPPDMGFTFLLPFSKLRALIAGVEPKDTPRDEEDSPGPVARWYGVVDERCFTVTCHYTGEPPHTVVVMYENTEGTLGLGMETIGAKLRTAHL